MVQKLGGGFSSFGYRPAHRPGQGGTMKVGFLATIPFAILEKERQAS